MCESAKCCDSSRSCISQVPVFQNLSLDEEQLLSSITSSIYLTKGSYVFHTGEQSDALFVLHEGLIKLTKTSDHGKEHVLRFLFPGDFLGQFALFQQKNHYATAEVLEPSVICRLHRKDFLPLLERQPQLTYSFLLALSEQLQQADEWAGAMHVLDVEQRLAKMLLYYWRKQGLPETGLQLPAAKKELSAMIGTTPESLSRKLTQWVQSEIIGMKNRTIQILDLEYLNRLSGS